MVQTRFQFENRIYYEYIVQIIYKITHVVVTLSSSTLHMRLHQTILTLYPLFPLLAVFKHTITKQAETSGAF